MITSLVHLNYDEVRPLSVALSQLGSGVRFFNYYCEEGMPIFQQYVCIPSLALLCKHTFSNIFLKLT